ncbi:hypothetical protein O1611_g283 [Lasiodiplodia mahajangana]|uniref:Uncharacterized protein n=1 Tax=Lasiodiplodia mahajangana TaxID=1108764 RepID=A0ACC2K0M8_9PEZI|nr:hypothetical protein O1611_g283 [Lasiodiplodia mahajangana]
MASEEWERYKGIILNLYLLEGNPLREIVSYMQQKHNFIKKPSQYEYQFKKWGVKKNLKRKDWENLHSQLQKRAGKQSEVTVHGFTLSAKKVRRETQRYATIPTAKKFGKRVHSPEAGNNTMIARVRSPKIVENIAWPHLPWFDFKRRIMPVLENPSDLLNIMLAPIFSGKTLGLSSVFGVSRSIYKGPAHPLELWQAILRHSDAIPDNSEDTLRRTQTTEQLNKPLFMATRVLRFIFFRLSNKLVFLSDSDDQFILHLVDAFSRSNQDILSRILSGNCESSNAIKEEVYGSAIRQKNYRIVSRLLDLGVDPHLPISGRYDTYGSTLRGGRLRGGIINLDSREMRIGPPCGMQEAALACDTRLGRLLFKARAKTKDTSPTRRVASLSSMVALTSGHASDFEASMEFMQLLAEHGALTSCTRSELASAIGISISVGNNRVAEFLIEEGATIIPREEVFREYVDRGIYSDQLQDFGINLTPLNIAIISENGEMIERLLQPVLSHTTHISAQDIRHLLITSCSVGDVDTTSKVLMRHPNILCGWTQGITPLAATAWNQDNTIAELLLSLGAHVGPTPRNGILERSAPAPLHVAAWHGNTDLVQRLMDNDADCNVRYAFKEGPLFRRPRLWIPEGIEGTALSPLQLALGNENLETALALIPFSNLFGGELAMAVQLGDEAIISEIISKKPDIASIDIWRDETAFEAAVKVGNLTVIALHFSQGGSYESKAFLKAVEASIKTKDYSIVHTLASCRPIGEIDSDEAFSLVLSIEAREWDLAFLLIRDPFLPARLSPCECYDAHTNPLEVSIVDKDYCRCWTPLSVALLSENMELIDEMTQRGYIFRSCDVRALQHVTDATRQAASSKFHLETMDLSCQRIFLLYAIASGDVERVLRHIRLVDTMNFVCLSEGKDLMGLISPLIVAVHIGNTEIISIILGEGANIDFEVDGETALARAVDLGEWRGKLDVVELLLDRGASIQDLYDFPSFRMCSLLLDHGFFATSPLQVIEGVTVLGSAVRNGDFEMAQLLLSRGVDVNAVPTEEGSSTALEAAAKSGKIDMIHLLLGTGAKIDGEMRIYYVRSVGFAIRRGHWTIANFLKEYGSWSIHDQILYDSPGILADPARFSYDEENDCWHPLEHAPPGCDVSSIAQSSCSSEDLSAKSSESLYEEQGMPDGRVRPEEYAAYESEWLPSSSHNKHFVPQLYQNNIIPPHVVHNQLNFADNPTLDFDTASLRIPDYQRVIELDETERDNSVAQLSSDYNCHNTTASSAMGSIENKAAMDREELPDFEEDTYDPGAEFRDRQIMPLTDEMDWESVFASVDFDELNYGLEVW